MRENKECDYKNRRIKLETTTIYSYDHSTHDIKKYCNSFTIICKDINSLNDDKFINGILDSIRYRVRKDKAYCNAEGIIRRYLENMKSGDVVFECYNCEKSGRYNMNSMNHADNSCESYKLLQYLCSVHRSRYHFINNR